MKPLNFAIASTCLALALSGCVDRQAQKTAAQTQAIVTDPVKLVSAQPAKRQTITESLEITGEVVTSDDSQVSAKQTGRLISVTVRDGDSVSAGQVIARQDASQLQAQYRQALAGVASAQSQLSQAISNARLSPSKSSAAVRQAQAQVASARQVLASARAQFTKTQAGARPEERLQSAAAVRSAKAALDKSQKDLQRATQLVAQGASSQSELDAAQASYDAALSNYQTAVQSQAIQQNGARSEDIAIAQAAVSQAQDGVRQAQEGLRSAQASQGLDVLLTDAVRTAQAQVASARAQADAANVAIQDTVIRAPFTGKIAGKPLQTGVIASAGTPIARIVGAQGAYFEGQVSEDQVRSIVNGQSVTVRLDALPGKTFGGTVQAVSGLGSDVGRLFKVRVALIGGLQDVRPGMFAHGSIQLRTVPDAVVVPSTAIVKKNNQDVVFIVNGAAAKAVNVTRGIIQGDLVQVVGLQPNDLVIVQGQTELDNGSKIKVDKAATASGAAKVGA